MRIGKLPIGKYNAIVDVPGVKVGHVTLSSGAVQTGVTAVLPHSRNLFKEKVPAAAHVINGFGKTVGIVQIEELGQIETPIILTNTLSVGRCSEALVEYALKQNPEIGRTTGTVNPVVAECNDGYLNDIRGLHVSKEHVWQAIAQADDSWSTEKEGAVGAGTGMSCYGLKGGIGSASRVIKIDNEEYVVGILALTNFGRLEDLIVNGKRVGPAIQSQIKQKDSPPDQGSVIVVLATNLPVSDRQLGRMARRVSAGLARTGTYIGHGSGDIVLAFSTANLIPHEFSQAVRKINIIDDGALEGSFQAVVEGSEESVLKSMIRAKSVTGRDGHHRYSLQEFLDLIEER